MSGPPPSAGAPIAHPRPLGLAAFGITFLVLSVVDAGWISSPQSATPVVAALAIPFGGLAEGLAGVWAFKRGGALLATVLLSYAAFWISYFLLVIGYAAAVGDQRVLSGILGWYLLAWSIFSALMFIASARDPGPLSVVLGLASASFLTLSIGAYTSDPLTVWTKIGGYIGLVTAASALITSFADLLKATLKRTVSATEL